MKIYIVGMSKSKGDLGAWIEDRTYPAMRVLAQMYMFPNCSRMRHWREKLWAAFNEMHVLRHSKKLPSARFIYENSWGVDKIFVQDAMNWAINKEKDLTPNPNAKKEELYKIMDAYFKWLSEELSKHKDITSEQVYAKLDELGLTE